MSPIIAIALIASMFILAHAYEQTRHLELRDVMSFAVPSMFCLWACVAIALNI